MGKAARRYHKSTRQKESGRWLEAMEAAEGALPPDRVVITIADCEADIYDLFARARREGSHLLIRIKPTRGIRGPERLLGEAVRASAPGGTMSVEIGRADDRPPRTAVLTIRYAAVEIKAPKNRRGASRLPDVPLTVILAEEESPPEGGEPVCWWPATTLPMRNLADAQQAVRWYALRWLVERYHFVLRSGCRVERLQPRDLTGDESDPMLREAVRRVAMLGGFLGRKGDGEPGVKTIWRGLRRLQDMAVGYAMLLDIIKHHMP